MKVKVLKTTDKKYEGMTFIIDDLTSESIESVTGKNFDFHTIKHLDNNEVELQSSNYTVRAVIIE